MKKSLLLLAMCLTTCVSTYAQDDDVYFVPSSKDKVQYNDTYTANSGRSTYTPISTDDASFSSSNWADGRSNGQWDVDTYNRRGRNYKKQLPDSLTSQQTYDQGYADGYEDGSCTARIVRFGSPRAGVIVSSPFYWDYYDLCYDPFYYGYGSPWSWGWSGWYGWGSWYGWRPYYSSWSWCWGSPWYDPWYGPCWGGGPHWVWHPAPLPSNAQRGPVGGWTARGGARGAGSFTGNSHTSRGNTMGIGTRSYGNTSGRGFGTGSTGTRSYGNTSGRGFGAGSTSNRNMSNRSFGTTPSNNNRGWNNTNTNRTYSQPSQPSRSSFGSGSSNGGSRGFGGGSSVGSGGRSFGGGGGSRGGGRGFGGR